MLLLLPTFLRNILTYFGFYKFAKETRMDPSLSVLACHRLTEVDCSLSRDSDEFLEDNLATGTGCAYPANISGLVERQKVSDGPVLSMLAPAVNVKLLPDAPRNIISNVESDDQRYPGLVDVNGGNPADILANAADDIDNIFAQKVLWETGGSSSLSVGDHLVFIMD